MDRSEYQAFDGVGLADLIRRKQISADEAAAVARSSLIAAHASLNCLAELYDDCDAPAAGPLHAVPMLYKDAGAHQSGRAQQAGSRLLAGHVPATESAVARRLRSAGLVAMGRSASSELTYHTSVESSAFGPVRNPWHRDHSAGGSSGGAAAAVAAGAVPIAHATDGGGSIRIPAAWCGLVGLKPGRGRVSAAPDLDEALFGMAAEHVLTRSVRDSAVVLDRLCGHEVGDPFLITPPDMPYAALVDRPPAHLRIGLVCNSWLPDCPVDPQIAQATVSLAQFLAGEGHVVTETAISIDGDAWLNATTATWCSQIAAWVASVAAATGRDPDSHLETATRACYHHGLGLSAMDLNFALLTLNAVRRRVAEQLAQFDLVITPTTATIAPPLGHLDPAQPVASALAWTRHMFQPAPFTALFNTTGQPALSLPAGWHGDGLPIGVQLVAPHGQEGLLLQLAGLIERARPWNGRRPAHGQ